MAKLIGDPVVITTTDTRGTIVSEVYTATLQNDVASGESFYLFQFPGAAILKNSYILKTDMVGAVDLGIALNGVILEKALFTRKTLAAVDTGTDDVPLKTNALLVSAKSDVLRMSLKNFLTQNASAATKEIRDYNTSQRYEIIMTPVATLTKGKSISFRVEYLN